MTAEALIDPRTLRAARARAGVDLDALAAKLQVAGGAERIAAWEAGAERPSFAQARRLAEVLHVPFASLFLAPSTLGTDDLPDLRTIGARRARCSVDLVDVYHDALRKQAWVREVREREGHEPLDFVGAARGSDDVRRGAIAIRDLLRLLPSDAREARDTEAYFRLLVARAEEARVLVLRSSTVGSNTHRKLDVEEFRGFAISDPIAPLVFINTADAKAAQVFSLIHELAHVWRAETGVSQPALEAPRTRRHDTEALCDAIAAEVLVPEAELRAAWRSRATLRENADALRVRFRVSGLVIARHALDAGLVTRRMYAPYVADEMKRARAVTKAGGAPSFLVMVATRNGATVTDMVARAVRGGELLWREAGAILGVTPKVVGQLVEPSSSP